MLKKILIGLVVVVALFLGYVAMKPSEFHVVRETTINAPAEVVFVYVNSPRKMDIWNPWMKMDPAIKASYSGPESGVGAGSSWEGPKMGSGSATVIDSVKNSLVRTRLDFLKPFKSTSITEFSLKPNGKQTTIAWSISGHSAFIPRIFCTLMAHGYEDMMGGTFEKGLVDLKTLAESTAKR
jgi:uncharacterized protein YndB with AHSA1/START domain